MKKIILSLIGIILFISLNSCWFGNDDEHENDIKLDIYGIDNDYHDYHKTIYLEDEGNFIVDMNSEVNYYDILASRIGYFTNLYDCEFGDTINVDLDIVVANKFCGVVFGEGNPPWSSTVFDIFYNSPNTLLNFYKDSLLIKSYVTDFNGRFAIDIEKGDYDCHVHPDSSTNYFSNVKVNTQSNYQDIYYDFPSFVKKPNIYIYPTEETILSVKLNFLQGGSITKSIPDYDNGNGWKNLTVKPNGTINDKYGFLFYEAIQPDKWQYKTGWVIKNENLETFFGQNLTETGFIEKEIDEFIEYWIPRLNKFDYYALYPQYKSEIDKLIELKISQKPDNILRLFYVIDGMNKKINLTEPTIPEFNRVDFVVTEWGGILR